MDREPAGATRTEHALDSPLLKDEPAPHDEARVRYGIASPTRRSRAVACVDRAGVSGDTGATAWP